MNYSIHTSSRGPRTLAFDNGPRVGATRHKAERAQRRKLVFWRGMALVQFYLLVTLAIIHFTG